MTTAAAKKTTPAKRAAAKTPQDRRPKVTAKAGEVAFSVGVGDKRRDYVLPRAKPEDASRVPGDVTFDAIMEPENELAQIRLGFAMLQATDAAPEVMAALKSLPSDEMMKVVGRWMGESRGSSA